MMVPSGMAHSGNEVGDESSPRLAESLPCRRLERMLAEASAPASPGQFWLGVERRRLFVSGAMSVI